VILDLENEEMGIAQRVIRLPDYKSINPASNARIKNQASGNGKKKYVL
jgi:hypothetical protein